MNVRSAGAVTALLVVGSFAGAFSRWLIVWLAQELGGVSALGAYSAVLAFATPIFVVGQLGLRTIILTYREAYPWRTFQRIRFAGIVAACAVTLLFVLRVPQVDLAMGLAVLSFKVFDAAIDLEVARIQRAGKLLAVGYIGLATAGLSVLFSVAAAVMTKSIILTVLGTGLASAIAYLVCRSYARKIPYVATAESSGYRTILSASLPITGSQLVASLLLYVPVLWLTSTGDLAAVGIYTGVAYLLTAADLLGSSLAKVLISPFRGRLEAHGDNAVLGANVRLTLALIPLGIAAGAAVVVWGDPVLRFIYGPNFEVGRPTLALLAAASVFTVLSFVQSVTLEVFNRYYGVAAAFLLACLAALATGWLANGWASDPVMLGSAMSLVGAFVRFASAAGFAATGERDARQQPVPPHVD